jgi:hypothetical protein
VRLPRPEDPHTTEQAAAALDIPPRLIRQWKTRGLVMPTDYLTERVRGDGRRPLFLLEELRPRADAYHRRQTRRDDMSAPS